MKQPSIRNELLMKVVCLDIELERWGNNANMVTLTYMQRKVHEGTYMSLLSEKHCNLYISRRVLHVHVKTHEGLEIKSTNKGFL
jgi:hypothetical protein